MIVAYSMDYLIMLIISFAQLWIHMSFFLLLVLLGQLVEKKQTNAVI